MNFPNPKKKLMEINSKKIMKIFCPLLKLTKKSSSLKLSKSQNPKKSKPKQTNKKPDILAL